MTLSMMLHAPSRLTSGGMHGEVEKEPPKRPPSAYNIFFQVERQRLITDPPQYGEGAGNRNDTNSLPYTKSEVYSICLDKATRIEKSKRPHRKQHGKISFTDLAKTIASKWKALDGPQKMLFEERADTEKAKYAAELEEWLLCQIPTQQVKKRLSALRRGSLGKFLPSPAAKTLRKKSLPEVQMPSLLELHRQRPPSPPRREAMVHTISEESSPLLSDEDDLCDGMGTPTEYHKVTPPTVPRSILGTGLTADKTSPERRRIQLQRARNLERLYQMQIQLYNEQMKLHAECNGAFEEAYVDPDLTVPPPSPPSPPPALAMYGSSANTTNPCNDDGIDDIISSTMPAFHPPATANIRDSHAFSGREFDMLNNSRDGMMTSFSRDCMVGGSAGQFYMPANSALGTPLGSGLSSPFRFSNYHSSALQRDPFA